MVCCGTYRNREMWHVEHQQHGGRCHHRWMPDCFYSWRVHEDDHGTFQTDPIKALDSPHVVLWIWAMIFMLMLFWSSCSVKMLTQWQWMEDRRTQLESAVWFQSWWSNMMRVWKLSHKHMQHVPTDISKFLIFAFASLSTVKCSASSG